jgi:hypothetical protein
MKVDSSSYNLLFQNKEIKFFQGARVSPLRTAVTVWPIVPAQKMDHYDCGAIIGMKIGRGTEVVRENLSQCHFDHHKSHMT